MTARILALGLVLIGAGHLQAQEQRTVNGRKYTVHLVEAGQTLFAIARVNAVPVEVLLAVNPSAQDGLSIGEEVLVPQDAVVKKDLKRAPELRNGELVHQVRKKETLFGLARQYGVDMNQLLERNPGALNLHEGMELVIPVAKVVGAPANTLRPATAGGGQEHLVQAGETLFSLGKRYGLDPDAIKVANGGLPEGLKAGTLIRIPGEAKEDIASTPVVRIRERMRYKVGLLLPFSIARNDSVLARVQVGVDARYYEPTRAAIQFHNGARMAIDSLTALGLNADIDVLDVGDDSKVWNPVIKQPGIQDYDLFVGPFNRSAIEQLARTNPRAHIVCPVPQSSKVILGMPNVSKVSPTRSDLVKHAARFVANRFANANIVLLRPELASEKETQQQVLTTVNEALRVRTDRVRDSILVVRTGKRDLGDLAAKLDANRLNVLLALSDDVEFVTALVTKLKPLAAKYRIRLVGTESWTTMPSVAAADLDVLDFSFAAPAFYDPTDPRTVAFTARFRDQNKADVDSYALLGFDVTFYYLKALLTQGMGFADHFQEVTSEPLYMGFRMSRTGLENGFRNEFAIMLEQEDLRLVKMP
ncbi:MAG: LysM peptidoglycan-binding domain-containing protein [Flavobacteriales bacterium]|nr:LysM peptidoglycan-binding domain-containing protein [Flavobacteriales bacterium]